MWKAAIISFFVGIDSFANRVERRLLGSLLDSGCSLQSSAAFWRIARLPRVGCSSGGLEIDRPCLKIVGRTTYEFEVIILVRKRNYES
jgi:hypothetical protein